LTLRYLLDTNVISERLRPAPNRGIVERMRAHEEEIAAAAPVWHELVYGCNLLPPSRKRSAIEKFLYEVIVPSLPILPYDAAAAEWHGRERARLSREGRTPPFVDGQIAAIARTHDLEIVTTNPKDYLPFEGVRIRDWRS
jgi:tRNA(fMet)-specific endonuclease VapC